MKNPLKWKLKIAHDILTSDWAAEADNVSMDEINSEPVSRRERDMAEVIHRLYRLIHPLFCLEK